MKFFVLGASLLVTAVLSQSTQPANSRNVQVALDGTLVATRLNRGPMVLQVPGEDSITIGLPGGIVSMDDIVLSEEGWLFGLSAYTPLLCSFRVVTATLEPIGCIFGNFSLNNYTGLAAKGGTCVISGGLGGITVAEYDRETGTLTSTLRCLNCEIEVEGDEIDDLNFVEVALLDSRFASLSAIAGTGSINGTNHVSVVVDLNNNQVSTLHPVLNPANADLAATPTNYPFVTDFFRSTANGEDFMFTACGSITVQSVITANTTVVIDPPVQNFQAVTLMVDANVLVVAGRVMSSSYIAIYAIDPTNPTRNTKLDNAYTVDGTILALAMREGRLAYVTAENDGIITNMVSAQPSQGPSGGPSLSPSWSVTPSQVPSSAPSQTNRNVATPAPTARTTSPPSAAVTTTTPLGALVLASIMATWMQL